MRALTFLGISLLLTHLVLPLAGMTQEPGNVPRIGLLGPAANDPLVEAFKLGLPLHPAAIGS